MSKQVNNLKLVGPGAIVDPKKFNDPIALKTGWDEMIKSNDRTTGTHFKQLTRDRGRIRDPFYDVFLGNLPLFFAIGALLHMLFYPRKEAVQLISFEVIFFIIMDSVSILVFYNGLKPFVFDKKIGNVWRGYRGPPEKLSEKKMNENFLLDDIHALQIISKYVPFKHLQRRGTPLMGKDIEKYYYELNIVLKNARRINLLNHQDLDLIREDAEDLSEFLSIAIWDGVE